MPSTTSIDTIVPPKLEYEIRGWLTLSYDGWRDEVHGRIWAEHSNHKEMRWYGFRCRWEDDKGYIIDFSIAAKHLHPYRDGTKGTADGNRRDVKASALDRAGKWRRQKLKEQERLHLLIDSGQARQIEIETHWMGGFSVNRCTAWIISGCLLFEPAKCGKNCRDGWIEVISLGTVRVEIAEYLARLYFRGGPFDEAVELARNGTSLLALRDQFKWDTW